MSGHFETDNVSKLTQNGMAEVNEPASKALHSEMDRYRNEIHMDRPSMLFISLHRKRLNELSWLEQVAINLLATQADVRDMESSRVVENNSSFSSALTCFQSRMNTFTSGIFLSFLQVISLEL